MESITVVRYLNLICAGLCLWNYMYSGNFILITIGAFNLAVFIFGKQLLDIFKNWNLYGNHTKEPRLMLYRLRTPVFKFYTVVHGVVVKLMLGLFGYLKALLILSSLVFVFAGTILIYVSGLIELKSYSPMQTYLANQQSFSSHQGQKSTQDT